MQRSSWSRTVQRWTRAGWLSGCTLAAIHCGHSDNSTAPGVAGAHNDAGEAGAAGSARNECDGELPLRFASKAARVGDACGECADGKLICGAPDVLVCLGARAALPDCSGPVDSGSANPCGGFSELEFDGQPAAPGAACGACNDGVLICTSPTLLACYGGQATGCADGGAAGTDAGTSSGGFGGGTSGNGGAGGADTGGSNYGGTSGNGGAIGGASGAAGSGGKGGSSGSSGAVGSAGAGACSGTGYTYLGHSASVGDACGACSDGQLVCPGGSTKTLYCSGATPTGYCGDPASAPNTCGGIGPLLWRGVVSSPLVRCGGCGYGKLGCATKNLLTCSSQTIAFTNSVCANPPEYSTCAIPSSAYTAPPVYTPPAPLPDTKPIASSFQSMNLTVNAFAYNAFDRRLYATVPGNDGPNGNSVAVIDPATPKVLQYVPVGSEPKALAISDDGKVLWVINTGSKTLRRVDLVTLTTGPVVPLGDDDYGRVGQRLSILPGTRDSVIVGSNGLTIYDNGVPRTMAAQSDGLLTVPTYSPFLAYGFNNNSTSFELVTFCVNQYGIFTQRSQENVLSGDGANLLFDSGILYGSSGAYDINEQSVIGSYPVADAVTIDPANRRIFTLRRFQTTQFVAYDMDSFVALGSDPAFPTIKAERPQIARWGRYGIAFTNSTDLFGPSSLYIGRSTLVP